MANKIVQYPVPLIFKKILKEKISGELNVTGKNFNKTIYFKNKNLVFAKTNLIQERLGEILFKLGKIDKVQYWNIQKLLQNQQENLGRILVKNNVLSQKDLFFALLYQVKTIALSTFNLKMGEWEFKAKTPDIPEDSVFNIELPTILTEGIKNLENIFYYRNKFIAMAPTTIPIPEYISEFLSAENINFYRNIAKYNNCSNEQLLLNLKLSDNEFWKNITILYLLNIVDFIDIKINKELSKNIDEIIGLYEKLKSDKIDYYELFKLDNSATFKEIKDAYFAFAKKYHPDRIAKAPDPEIKEKANFVFAEINKAYEILTNIDKKREYDTSTYKEFQSSDKIQENLIGKARVLYRKAKTLYDQRKFWEVTSFMEEAISADSHKPTYFLLLGLAQMHIPSMIRMAEKNLMKVIEAEPWNPEPLVGLGMLFQSQNLEQRAAGFYRKALSLNPDHQIARKRIELLQGKTTGKKSFWKKLNKKL